MLELTPQQVAVLERLRERGFDFVAWPLYASHVGVRRGECAALLAPVSGGGMQVFGAAFYVVAGNPGVRVCHDGRDWFVWKSSQLEATPERTAALARFEEELAEHLMASA